MLHEINNQLEMIGSVTKWAARAMRPEDVPGIVREAFRQLRTGRPRPVEIEIPPDVLQAEADVQLLDPANQLLRHGQVALRTHRLHVVQNDRFAEAGGFGEPHVARNRYREHAATEVLLRLFRDLLGEVEAGIVHREEGAFDGERGIEIALH